MGLTPGLLAALGCGEGLEVLKHNRSDVSGSG